MGVSDTRASLRLRKGTKFEDVPPAADSELPSFHDLDSPFQVSEWLSMLVLSFPDEVETIIELPDPNLDRDLWLYEQLRRLPQDFTLLVTSLLKCCSRATCPKMSAGEDWIFLCVAHIDGATGNPIPNENCCAIDYCLHTLATTEQLLSSSKDFPSRLTIPEKSKSHFSSLARRLSRIFSHAYFHHREVFESAELETSLYARFLALCREYNLVTPDLLVIPSSSSSSYSVPGSSFSDEDDTDVHNPFGDHASFHSSSRRSAPAMTASNSTDSIQQRPQTIFQHRIRTAAASEDIDEGEEDDLKDEDEAVNELEEDGDETFSRGPIRSSANRSTIDYEFGLGEDDSDEEEGDDEEEEEPQADRGDKGASTSSGRETHKETLANGKAHFGYGKPLKQAVEA